MTELHCSEDAICFTDNCALLELMQGTPAIERNIRSMAHKYGLTAVVAALRRQQTTYDSHDYAIMRSTSVAGDRLDSTYEDAANIQAVAIEKVAECHGI